MKIFRKALITLFVFSFMLSSAQEFWTIGPMLKINFGGEKKWTVSYALEGAYWNVSAFPHSADVGLEFEKGKFRIYSEAQTGIGVAGLSAGPVLQFGSGIKLGWQGSLWVNYYLGADYRIRFIEKERYHCVGLYAKVPFSTNASGSDGDSGDWD
jgi:hypothetical protein